MKLYRFLAAAAVLAFGAAVQAGVGDTANYSFSDAASGFDVSGGNYGNVLLTQTDKGVTFDVSLRSDLNFVSTGSTKSHSVFAFNGLGVSLDDISIATDASNHLFRAVTPGRNSTFGTFSFAFICDTNCSKGGSAGGYPDPLHFSVNDATLADFATLSSGGSVNSYFAADVYTTLNVKGNTGPIGVTQTGALVSAVPEPAPFAFMAAGICALGVVVRRRRMTGSVA